MRAHPTPLQGRFRTHLILRHLRMLTDSTTCNCLIPEQMQTTVYVTLAAVCMTLAAVCVTGRLSMSQRQSTEHRAQSSGQRGGQRRSGQSGRSTGRRAQGSPGGESRRRRSLFCWARRILLFLNRKGRSRSSLWAFRILVGRGRKNFLPPIIRIPSPAIKHAKYLWVDWRGSGQE